MFAQREQETSIGLKTAKPTNANRARALVPDNQWATRLSGAPTRNIAKMDQEGGIWSE